MAEEEEEEINFRQLIRQVHESASYGTGRFPIVWDFRNGARDQIHNALAVAQQMAAGAGYETTPVYDYELVNNPSTAYSVLRTAIRRSTQIFVEEPITAPPTEIVFDPMNDGPAPLEFPTDEAVDLEEDF